MATSPKEKTGVLRALALAACTLWGNILLLDVPGSVLLSVPFASRMVSMAFSVVGFAAVWIFAQSCVHRPLRRRPALLAAAAALSAVGSFLHFSGFAWLPGWADLVSVAVFSVAFAFLLVACGEVYAAMQPGRAVVCASLSYLLAYLGSTLVGGMGPAAVCMVETLLPLVVLALVAQRTDGACESAATADVGPAAGTSCGLGAVHAGAARATRAGGVSASQTVRLTSGIMRATLDAIPARVLTAIAITYFAIGSTLSLAGSPVDYFSWGTALAAVLTSVAVMGIVVLLQGRVSLTGLYKVLMVGQVLAAFLLSEWAAGAQIALVITFVGVKIVAWTLMAELAMLARARGRAPAALVYAAGCLAGHIGEGAAGVISVFGLVGQGPLTIVVVGLLVAAAAFLFTGELGKYPDISDDAQVMEGGAVLAGTNGSRCREGAVGHAMPGRALSGACLSSPVQPGIPNSPAAGAVPSTLDVRISELASAYMLSARETDVFRLWATGHTLKYIQEKLTLSPSTVKTHVRHIYEKTGVHSRAEIVELLDPLADERP